MTMQTELKQRFAIGLTLLAVTAIGVLLAWALWSLPAESVGLSLVVNENIPLSGVSAPVTAILLNFRGYDTLLELVVLLAALLGAWYQGRLHLPGDMPVPGPVLESLVRLLVPVIIVVTGYVLWLGSHAAGGAFQAGALLAGAGVMTLVVYADRLPMRDGIRTRTLLVAGPLVFTVVAGGLWLGGASMLQYPPGQAGALILLVEAAATLTIGLTLTLLFAGGRPRHGDRD